LDGSLQSFCGFFVDGKFKMATAAGHKLFFFAFVGYYLENYNREKLIENDQHHNIRNKSLPLN